MNDQEAAAVLRRMFDEWWDIDGDRDERAAIQRAIAALEWKDFYTLKVDTEQWAKFVEQHNRMTS